MEDNINLKKLSHSYDKISEVMSMPSHFYDAILNFISRFLSIRRLKILDIGCGRFRLSISLHQQEWTCTVSGLFSVGFNAHLVSCDAIEIEV